MSETSTTTLSTPTIAATLLDCEQQLSTPTCLRPRRHAELLLEHVLNCDRTELYLSAHDLLSAENLIDLQQLLNRRIDGEPIQYIVGWAPFFGRKFKIRPGVLIPRFDTETIIEHLLRIITERKQDLHTPFRILDLCSGSGILGITAALELPESIVTLVDNSEVANECALENTHYHGVIDRVSIVRSDVFDFIEESTARYDYILANPPYIPADHIPTLHTDVKDGEPHSALTDGSDGLSFYRQWADRLPCASNPNAIALLEIGIGQSADVLNIFRNFSTSQRIHKDISTIDRVVELQFKRSNNPT